MSLIDFTDPRRLHGYKRALRRGDPTRPLPTDLFCGGCDQPHDWCACAEQR